MQNPDETITGKTSCLTDVPLSSEDADALSAIDYARALCDFIKYASTPITIGIQGGWGSGKTSLIHLMRNIIENDTSHYVVCISMNAWEHSLFTYDKLQTSEPMSILNGLIEQINNVVNTTNLEKDVKKCRKGISGKP